MADKTIVLTLYGNKTTISDFSINLFDGSSWHNTAAQNYCNNINELELKDDNWVYSTVIEENKKTRFTKPRFYDFNILSSLDDRSIQEVLRKVDNHILGKALKAENKGMFSAILRNMTKRAAIMLIEEMDYMGPIRLKDVQEAQRSIISIIRHLEDTGQIVVGK
jgi:flagellar motor switch protein FliG